MTSHYKQTKLLHGRAEKMDGIKLSQMHLALTESVCSILQDKSVVSVDGVWSGREGYAVGFRAGRVEACARVTA